CDRAAQTRHPPGEPPEGRLRVPLPPLPVTPELAHCAAVARRGEAESGFQAALPPLPRAGPVEAVRGPGPAMRPPPGRPVRSFGTVRCSAAPNRLLRLAVPRQVPAGQAAEMRPLQVFRRVARLRYAEPSPSSHARGGGDRRRG